MQEMNDISACSCEKIIDLENPSIGLDLRLKCKKHTCVHEWRCSLCGRPYNQNTTYEHTYVVGEHLNSAHNITTSRKFMHFVQFGMGRYYLMVNAYMKMANFYVNVPTFIMMFLIPEYDIKDLGKIVVRIRDEYAEYKTKDLDDTDYNSYVSCCVLDYMMRGQYSCSICGGEYDTISKEVCEKHIKSCVASLALLASPTR
jgi:rubredoxin